MGRNVRSIVRSVVLVAGLFGSAGAAEAAGIWYPGGFPVVAGPVFAPRPFYPAPVVVGRPIYPAPIVVSRPIYPAPVVVSRPIYPAPVVVAPAPYPYRYAYRTARRAGRWVW